MNLLSRSRYVAVGTGVVVGVLLLTVIAGADVARGSTYAAIAALLLALIGIMANTYGNARPDRTMGRLLHDPERQLAGNSAPKTRRAESRSEAR